MEARTIVKQAQRNDEALQTNNLHDEALHSSQPVQANMDVHTAATTSILSKTPLTNTHTGDNSIAITPGFINATQSLD